MTGAELVIISLLLFIIMLLMFQSYEGTTIFVGGMLVISIIVLIYEAIQGVIWATNNVGVIIQWILIGAGVLALALLLTYATGSYDNIKTRFEENAKWREKQKT